MSIYATLIYRARSVYCGIDTGDIAGRKEADQELVLLALPVAAKMLASGDAAAATDLPLLSQLSLGGSAIGDISRSNMGLSLAALVLFPGSYLETHTAWVSTLYSQCLATGAPLPLRLIAWALFPLFCSRMSCQGKDGYAKVAEKPRVTVDDPPQLLEVVANVLAFVSCARAGCLRVAIRAGAKQPAHDGDDSDSDSDDRGRNGTSVFSVVRNALFGAGRPEGYIDVATICSLYTCSKCDARAGKTTSVDADTRDDTPDSTRGTSVTLSDWLPYWFIASSRQHEATSARFVCRSARFVSHAPLEEIGLKASPLGQGIIRRLSSSSREIRLAAKDAILAYSQARRSDSGDMAAAKLANRAETLRIVLAMVSSAHSASAVDETLLLVAGGVGCASRLGDPAMCDIMPLLVKYYCHTNIFLRAVAMEQLLCVSQAHRVPLGRLLSYFAESIACTLAKTLDQPASACFRQCMEMLGVRPDQFLRRYQDEVVPALFVDGNDEALKRVAAMTGVRLPVLCVNQAAEIFARIFLMDDQPMQDAMARFVGILSTESELDKDEVEVNIPSLLRLCSARLVFSLVLALGEEDPTLRRRARSSLATVQGIVASATPDTSQGVATIVQQNAANMKHASADESPRSGLRPGRPSPGAALAQFLSRHILGVLAYMNELLREPEPLPAHSVADNVAVCHSERTQRKAICGIGELVALLGAEAAPHTNSIVASLTPPLGGPLMLAALEAWKILAESLALAQLSADQLNALMVPLLAAFITSDGEAKRLVAAAVDHVTGLHEHGIGLHHAQLCPIPDDPLLAKSYALVQRLEADGHSLRTRLAALAELLKAREPTVVLCASREMSKLLLLHGKQVSAWKQAFSSGDALVSVDLGGSRDHGRGSAQSDAAFVCGLVDALRLASSVSGPLSEAASASCAACLATIGTVDCRALDTGNLNQCDLRGSGSARPALHDLSDDDERVEFICTLVVDYLSRAFAMAPSPSLQMSTAYSIQELLRLAGFAKDLLYDADCGDSGRPPLDKRGGKRRKADPQRQAKDATRCVWLRQRWEMLPPNVVEAIRPLLDSKYTIHHSSRPAAEAQAEREPCVRASSSYAGWLRAWVVELVGLLRDSPAARLFKSCLSAIKEGTVDLAHFILPHVVYQFCLQLRAPDKSRAEPILVQDDDGDEILSDGEGSGAGAPASKAAEDPAAGPQADVVVGELRAVLSGGPADTPMPADQLQLCKVVALELLDACGSHVRAQQAARTAGKRSSRSDSRTKNATPEELALLDVVGAMSFQMVAQAAAACGQHERAIMYTELGLREGSFGKFPTLFGNVDDASVAAVQELCFGMGDADGVAGAALCRKQADHRLAIRRHEIEGNWAHALIGHESLLRLDPNSEESQIGWIECLQNMGQWEGAWAASKSLFQPDPRTDAEGRLSSACFAAAWRLGKWDWVQQTSRDANPLAGVKDGDMCALSPAQQRPLFDAVSSSLLLQISRCSGSSLRDLAPPLPLRLRAAAVDPPRVSSVEALLAELVDVAYRVAGRDLAKASAAHRHAESGLYATASTRDMAHEIHAHMLGDVALLGRHLADVLPTGGAPSAAPGGEQGHDCDALSGALGELLEQWRARIACLPPHYSAQEPVLALHARLYDMLLVRMHPQARADGGDCVCAGVVARQAARTRLQAAQLARLSRNRATALGILTYAELACATAPALLAPLQIEQAQILWDEGHAADAISTISRVADVLSARLDIANGSDGEPEAEPEAAPGDGARGRGTRLCLSLSDASETKAAFAKASLLLSRWQEVTSSVSSVQLLGQYEKILRVQESDRVHYALAQLYDSLFTTMTERDTGARAPKTQADHRSLQLATLQYYVVRHYSRTVVYSSRFLYRALPRLLTVWLDFGANILKPADAKNTRMVDRFKTANRVIANLAKRLPAYYFLVVLSQLVSRICHPNEDVFSVLEGIILRVLEQYPQQTLWQLVGVQRSTYAARAERCNAVLAKARALQAAEPAAASTRGRGRGIGDLIQQSTRLTDMLLALCNALPPARTITTMYMNKDFKALAKSVPLDIVVPLQRCLVPTLPDSFSGAEHELALSMSRGPLTAAGSPVGGGGGGSNAQSASQRGMLHQPFAGDLPTISSFANDIEVMHSLQRPKKIAAVGSDGQTYSFLCKPKDDLRKDARLMEFNSMINQLLGADSQTQKRGLHIRTYAVVPLNEECGLIEWVGPTTGIRHVLLRLYKEHGVTISMAQVKTILDNPGPSPEEQFTKKLLPLFPSVMHEWFLQSFPDPVRWLASRTGFTRSAAVMSMVGHILGLGDRHCENILLDESTGDVVHVDFNCLFDKGMTLEKPEKVPFRLTHNMVDSMGITGYEGAFRKTCELTLGLLREHRDTLMSVLESFLHDPLVEWSRRATRSNRAGKEATAGQPNEQAARCLSNIRKKLQGILQGMSPLSVEGQVDELISEATDPKRLFAMYVGWAAYM
ncbi:hypothetical protein LPJ61_000169 [Coemansia biformis]|uniref:non-specific serine/threonine protein kinase n=1 Tax=Coemansia biformis TaxID=1286918 RepID=A0A9W7YGR3_9FUNG|nr:hypothetical protein LPJ61_000169 [Coemansia biformis]